MSGYTTDDYLSQQYILSNHGNQCQQNKIIVVCFITNWLRNAPRLVNDVNTSKQLRKRKRLATIYYSATD